MEISYWKLEIMLFSLLAFAVSAGALFFSSQAVIFRLYRLTHSLNLIFFLLLPGIFLHEFSHILTAEILRVPTGELKLKPEIKEGGLSLGSAQIGATDPFRLTLIGLAPFISGLTVLWLLIKFNPGGWWQILFGYLAFTIANTLFSSPSDLQAAAVPIVLVLILFGVFQMAHLFLPPTLVPALSVFFLSLVKIFCLALALNLLLLLPLKVYHLKAGRPNF